MKKVFLLVVAFAAVLGCKNQAPEIDPARKAFEEAYLANMDLPETYEFIKMEKLDSATYQDIFDSRIRNMEKMSFVYDQEDHRKMEEVKTHLGDSATSIATYLYKFIVKGEYPFIGEAMPEIYVVMTSDYKIIESNVLQSEVTMNHYTLLPGYRKIVLGNE